MTSAIKNMLSDDKGNVSTMRIATLLIVATVLFNWTYGNIITGQIASFELNDLIAMLGPLGFKGYQKNIENKV